MSKATKYVVPNPPTYYVFLEVEYPEGEAVQEGLLASHLHKVLKPHQGKSGEPEAIRVISVERKDNVPTRHDRANLDR